MSKKQKLFAVFFLFRLYFSSFVSKIKLGKTGKKKELTRNNKHGKKIETKA